MNGASSGFVVPWLFNETQAVSGFCLTPVVTAYPVSMESALRNKIDGGYACCICMLHIRSFLCLRQGKYSAGFPPFAVSLESWMDKSESRER